MKPLPGEMDRDDDDGISNFYWIATYSAKEVDSGMGNPSSLNPLICISIAWYIFCSASSRAVPVAAHPDRSGE
jgi:hypothetical protein